MKRFTSILCALLIVAGAAFFVTTARAADEKADGEKNISVNISGDYMMRSESISNSDLSTGQNNHGDFTGQRIRLNLAGKSDDVDYFIQILDGREWGNERSTGATADDSLDLLQGYIEFGGDTRLRLGRQEITYGKKRLIGSSSWAYKNLPAFDGIRVFHNIDNHKMDAFVVKESENTTTINDDTTLFGFSWTYKGDKVWEPGFYALYKDSEDDPTTAANERDKILNLSFIGTVKPAPAFVLDWEIISQTGSDSGNDQSALFYHFGGKYTEPEAKRFWLALEYNYASGDDNAADKKTETFNRMYGINHSHYGYMDFQNPQNMKNLRFTVGGQVRDNVSVDLDYHIFKLAEAKDRWQGRNYTGAALQDATGASGTDAGTELDLTGKIKLSKGLNVEVGFAKYFIGSFIKNRIGVTAKDADWGYLMLNKSF